jgi:hypothetical protein
VSSTDVPTGGKTKLKTAVGLAGNSADVSTPANILGLNEAVTDQQPNQQENTLDSAGHSSGPGRRAMSADEDDVLEHTNCDGFEEAAEPCGPTFPSYQQSGFAIPSLHELLQVSTPP